MTTENQSTDNQALSATTAAPTAPEPAVSNGVVPLSKPINAHGAVLTELTLVEPTLGLLDDINISVTASGAVQFNTSEVKKVISKLAGIPPSSVDQIALKDVGVLGKSLTEFFEEFLKTGE